MGKNIWYRISNKISLIALKLNPLATRDRPNISQRPSDLIGPSERIFEAPRAPRLHTAGFLAPSMDITGRPKTPPPDWFPSCDSGMQNLTPSCCNRLSVPGCLRSTTGSAISVPPVSLWCDFLCCRSDCWFGYWALHRLHLKEDYKSLSTQRAKTPRYLYRVANQILFKNSLTYRRNSLTFGNYRKPSNETNFFHRKQDLFAGWF